MIDHFLIGHSWIVLNVVFVDELEGVGPTKPWNHLGGGVCLPQRLLQSQRLSGVGVHGIERELEGFSCFGRGRHLLMRQTLHRKSLGGDQPAQKIATDQSDPMSDPQPVEEAIAGGEIGQTERHQVHRLHLEPETGPGRPPETTSDLSHRTLSRARAEMGVRMFIHEPAGPTTEGFIIPVQLGVDTEHVRQHGTSRATGMDQTDVSGFRRLDQTTKLKQTTDHSPLEARPGRGHLRPPPSDREPILIRVGWGLL